MLESALAGYPGRGIAHHVDADGRGGWIYFLTGRSATSRHRRISAIGGALIVEPTEPDATSDVLRHYPCARRIHGGGLIIGNGTHVDDIAAALARGETIEAIAATIDPEPDPPLFTPRIALVLTDRRSTMTIARSGSAGVERLVHDVDTDASKLTVLTTYLGGDGNPLAVAPLRKMEDPRGLDQVARSIWEMLDRRHRIALVAAHVPDVEPGIAFADH